MIALQQVPDEGRLADRVLAEQKHHRASLKVGFRQERRCVKITKPVLFLERANFLHVEDLHSVYHGLGDLVLLCVSFKGRRHLSLRAEARLSARARLGIAIGSDKLAYLSPRVLFAPLRHSCYEIPRVAKFSTPLSALGRLKKARETAEAAG